jgi:hypothetical protein
VSSLNRLVQSRSLLLSIRCQTLTLLFPLSLSPFTRYIIPALLASIKFVNQSLLAWPLLPNTHSCIPFLLTLPLPDM